jgi:hypothetical protein
MSSQHISQYVNLYTGKRLQGKKDSFYLGNLHEQTFLYSGPINSLELSPGVIVSLYDTNGKDYIYRSENAFRKINLPQTVYLEKIHLRGLPPLFKIYRGDILNCRPFVIYGSLEIPKITGSPFEKLLSGHITITQEQPNNQSMIIFYERSRFNDENHRVTFKDFFGRPVFIDASIYRSLRVIPDLTNIQPIRQDQLPSSNYQIKSSNGQLPVSNGQYPLSNGQYPVSNGQLPVSNGQYPVSNGQLPVSNGQYPVSNGQLPVSNGQLPVSNGQLPVSNGQLPEIVSTQITERTNSKPVMTSGINWLIVVIIVIIIILLIAIFAQSFIHKRE